MEFKKGDICVWVHDSNCGVSGLELGDICEIVEDRSQSDLGFICASSFQRNPAKNSKGLRWSASAECFDLITDFAPFYEKEASSLREIIKQEVLFLDTSDAM